MRSLFLSHTYLDPTARGKLRALVAQGCTVTVAVPERWPDTENRSFPHPPTVAAWQDDAGVRVVPIPVSGGSTPAWKGRPLERLISDSRPDLVQVEEELEAPISRLAGAITTRLGLPLILHSTAPLPFPGGPMARWWRRRTLRRARGLLAGSGLARDLLARECPGVPIAVMPRISLTPPLVAERRAPPEFTMAFVGRLIPEKGLDILLRACVKLHGRWRLQVIGSGPSQVALEELAESLGLGSRVEWLGALPPTELPTRWPAIDALIQPSRTTIGWVERWSYTLTEAMAYGVVGVTSNSGALPEVVGQAGIVTPENDVAALTAALQRLRDDRPARESLGAEGRKRILDEFGDAAIAAKTLRFWEEVRGGE